MKAASYAGVIFKSNRTVKMAKCLSGCVNQNPYRPSKRTPQKNYVTDTNRCPVNYCKLFEGHRPAEMNTPDAPFFLTIRHGNRRESSHIWYKKSPLGKNAIGQFMSKAADNAGLQRSGSKVSNHSVRKTSISRLLDANTAEIFVAQLSEDKSLHSLQL